MKGITYAYDLFAFEVFSKTIRENSLHVLVHNDYIGSAKTCIFLLQL